MCKDLTKIQDPEFAGSKIGDPHGSWIVVWHFAEGFSTPWIFVSTVSFPPVLHAARDVVARPRRLCCSRLIRLGGNGLRRGRDRRMSGDHCSGPSLNLGERSGFRWMQAWITGSLSWDPWIAGPVTCRPLDFRIRLALSHVICRSLHPRACRSLDLLISMQARGPPTGRAWPPQSRRHHQFVCPACRPGGPPRGADGPGARIGAGCRCPEVSLNGLPSDQWGCQSMLGQLWPPRDVPHQLYLRPAPTDSCLMLQMNWPSQPTRSGTHFTLWPQAYPQSLTRLLVKDL